MAKFTATIRHQARSRTRTIECGDDFAKAKRVALREFGFEQHDYEIVIYGEEAGCSPELGQPPRRIAPMGRRHPLSESSSPLLVRSRL